VSEVAALEAAFQRAWPALEIELRDGWLLRCSGGITRRGNSALAPPVDGPLDERIHGVERFYRERGLPPLFQVTPTSDPRLDTELETRGYRRESETIAAVAPLAGIATAAEVAVELTEEPTAAWLALLDRADGFGPRLGFAEQILAAIAVPAAYALVSCSGAPVAEARAVADGELLGIYQVATLPAFRRRGFARAVMAVLARWGEVRGATHGYVLVETENEAARGLYAQLGFEERFRYWYRTR
jgi:ribosomal protein S18 acetylase RimI-like enzyme